jgi:hypothetical protein
MVLAKADTGDFINIVQMVCDSIIKGYELFFPKRFLTTFI